MKFQLVAIVCFFVALQVTWVYNYDNICFIGQKWKVIPLILRRFDSFEAKSLNFSGII